MMVASGGYRQGCASFSFVTPNEKSMRYEEIHQCPAYLLIVIQADQSFYLSNAWSTVAG